MAGDIILLMDKDFLSKPVPEPPKTIDGFVNSKPHPADNDSKAENNTLQNSHHEQKSTDPPKSSSVPYWAIIAAIIVSLALIAVAVYSTILKTDSKNENTKNFQLTS